MSNTNQVCVTCTQRDSCQYYDTNRTLCVPVKVSDYEHFEGSLKQSTIDWQHYRIQAAIAAMQTVDDHVSTVEELAKRCVRYADALISELKKGGNYE